MVLKIFLYRLMICAIFISAGSIFSFAQTETLRKSVYHFVEQTEDKDFYSTSLVFINAQVNETTETEAASNSRIDFAIRKRFYINKRKDSTRIQSKDRFVDRNSRIIISKRETIGCSKDYCRINIGFKVSLKNTNKKITVPATIKSPYFTGRNSYTFSKFKTKTIMYEFTIKLGENKIIGIIDSDNSIREADETNNSFEAVITLVP